MGLRSAECRRGIGALMLAASLVLGCQSDEQKAAELLVQADRESAEEDHRQALVFLRKALKLEPANAVINERIADAFLALGQRNEAAFYYGETYRLDPRNTRAAMLQVPSLYESDPDAAAGMIREVLEQAPDEPLGHVRRAELALLRVETDEALEAALTAAQLAPDDLLVQRTLALVYRSRVREKRLRGHEVDPAEIAAAVEAYERAAALHEGGWLDRMGAAALLSRWPDQRQEAHRHWKAAFAAAGEAAEAERPAARRRVAAAALAYGARTQDAAFVEWALRARLQVDPVRGATWISLAALAGRLEEGGAERIWEEAFSRHPEEPGLRAARSRHLAMQGRWDEAVAGLEALPPAMGRSVEVLGTLAAHYLTMAKVDRAEAIQARLEAEYPDALQTRLIQARVLIRQQRAEEAERLLESLSARYESPRVWQLLALTKHQLGNPLAALAAVDRAFELTAIPSPSLHRLRVTLRAAVGDWEGTRAALREMRRDRVKLRSRDRLLFAQASYETGQRDPARRVLDGLIEQGALPIDTALVFSRYERVTEPKRGLELVEAALERAPDHEGLVRAAVALDLEAGEPERALARFGTGEVSPSLLLLRARVHNQLGRLAEAERDARAAFGHSPRPPGAGSLLTTILEQTERRPEAIGLLQSEAEAGTLSSQEYWLLGRMYLSEGQLPRARDMFEKTLEGRPGFEAARNDLAYVLAEIGDDLDRALALARAAREARSDDAAIADTLGWVYHRRGLHEPAAAEFRTAIQLASRHGAVPALFHYHLGLALQSLGRSAEAVEAFDAALAIDPSHEGAREARARAAVAAG